jgi:hypothetical protein
MSAWLTGRLAFYWARMCNLHRISLDHVNRHLDRATEGKGLDEATLAVFLPQISTTVGNDPGTEPAARHFCSNMLEAVARPHHVKHPYGRVASGYAVVTVLLADCSRCLPSNASDLTTAFRFNWLYRHAKRHRTPLELSVTKQRRNDHQKGPDHNQWNSYDQKGNHCVCYQAGGKPLR